MATAFSSQRPTQPQPQAVQQLVNALNSGQLAQAESLAKDLIKKHPSAIGSIAAKQKKEVVLFIFIPRAGTIIIK